METLKELVKKWEAEAQRLWDIADLGSSPIESAEANAEAGAYSMCAHQLAQAIKAHDDLIAQRDALVAACVTKRRATGDFFNGVKAGVIPKRFDQDGCSPRSSQRGEK